MFFKILGLATISILLVSCSSNKNNLNSTAFYDNVPEVYEYSGYKLNLPIELKNKLYTWTTPIKNYTPENFLIEGRDEKGTFEITRDFPTYTVNFNNNVEVLKIKFKTFSDIEKINSIDKAITNGIPSLIAAPFQVLSKVTTGNSIYQPSHVAISYDNQHWNTFTLDKNLYQKDNDAYVIENPFNKIKLKNVSFKVLALHGAGKDSIRRKIIYHPDELTYFVKNLEIEKEVIKYNLINRDNESENEDLIRFIAVNEPMFFRELQFNKNRYKLDSMSFLKLPNDININYCLNNFSQILTTGKYLDSNNKVKKFNVKDIYSEIDMNYNNATKKINISNDTKKINLKNQKNTNSTFIDFDKGI